MRKQIMLFAAFGLILPLALAVPAYSGNQEAKDVQAHLDAALRVYLEQPENIPSVIEPLNKGLAAYPDSIRLLQFRANFHCNGGMLAECRADNARVLELQPAQAEAFMMLCMLDEVEGAERQVYEACYLKAAELFAARSAPSRGWDGDLEISYKFNYVFALLLARHPDAEKEKAELLSRAAASHPSILVYISEMLNEFDRERILREVFTP